MPTHNLKFYFPLLKNREDVLKEINALPELKRQFHSFTTAQQEHFLDLCSGARGFRITYDGYFKYVFDTELHRDRLEALISAVLDQPVKIKEILPLESICVASDETLLKMDIIVELVDGSIANVEIQRHGYEFPGQRSACYASDLLLRQYKRVKDTASERQQMSYRDIKPVYTIVFFDKSPAKFRAAEYKNCFIHHGNVIFDSGIKLEMLQNYYFIPLDIFRQMYENMDIHTDLEAWLYFLAFDTPKHIMKLIETRPYFKECYDDLYKLADNVEKVMSMFSKELYELDKGTVQYMIDEMQETIDSQAETINDQAETINDQSKTINLQSAQITNLQAEIERLKALVPKAQTE